MAIEIIEIENPVEQDLSVPYGDRNIVIELRWNPLLNYWYFNMKENNMYIISGVTVQLNCNLIYDTLGLGKLYVIDTQQGTTDAPITKTDLGKRLALARDF